MKPRKPSRRQVFVLTSEEKKVVACIVGAFLLGLGTMHYRAQHPRPVAETKKGQQTKVAREKTKKTQPATRVARATPTARPDLEEDD